MSRELMDGVWVIKCDWRNPQTGMVCDLGIDGGPRMFIDPTGGQDPNDHFQCGDHHGYVKQENDPDFKLPEGHKLERNEEALVASRNYRPSKKVELDGFKPDPRGRVWDGGEVSAKR